MNSFVLAIMDRSASFNSCPWSVLSASVAYSRFNSTIANERMKSMISVNAWHSCVMWKWDSTLSQLLFDESFTPKRRSKSFIQGSCKEIGVQRSHLMIQNAPNSLLMVSCLPYRLVSHILSRCGATLCLVFNIWYRHLYWKMRMSLLLFRIR